MTKHYKAFEIEINTLGYYINRTFCVLVKLLNKELKDNNIDVQHAEFSIIMVINNVGAASQTQIANILGKERSGISKSLTSLERKGYIKRVPINGSTNNVTLTEKGQKLIPLFCIVAEKVTQQALKGFSNKSRVSLINNLNKIYNNYIEIDK